MVWFSAVLTNSLRLCAIVVLQLPKQNHNMGVTLRTWSLELKSCTESTHHPPPFKSGAALNLILAAITSVTAT